MPLRTASCANLHSFSIPNFSTSFDHTNSLEENNELQQENNNILTQENNKDCNEDNNNYEDKKGLKTIIFTESEEDEELQELDREIENIKYVEQVKLIEKFFENAVSSIPLPPPGIIMKDGEAEEIDVVISGGGTKGYYVVGAYAVLNHLIQNNCIKVMRWSGASVGAASAVFMCCGVSPIDWVSTYWVTRKNIAMKKISIAEGFRERATSLLPSNAHELCNGKVFISITKLTLSGPTNMIVSEFESKEDLIEACVASLSIPFITSHKVAETFRGEKVWDGGVTNNSPTFSDSELLNRRQLYFNVSKAPYPTNMSFQFNDSCIESLVVRGVLLMRQFILGQLSKKVYEIQWFSNIEHNEKNRSIHSSNNIIHKNEESGDQSSLSFKRILRSSLTTIRSAPNLLKFSQNQQLEKSLDHHQQIESSSPIHLENHKDLYALKKKKIWKLTFIILFTFCVAFLLSKQGAKFFGASKMRIPMPCNLVAGMSFLSTVFRRPTSLLR